MEVGRHECLLIPLWSCSLLLHASFFRREPWSAGAEFEEMELKRCAFYKFYSGCGDLDPKLFLKFGIYGKRLHLCLIKGVGERNQYFHMTLVSMTTKHTHFSSPEDAAKSIGERRDYVIEEFPLPRSSYSKTKKRSRQTVSSSASDFVDHFLPTQIRSEWCNGKGEHDLQNCTSKASRTTV